MTLRKDEEKAIKNMSIEKNFKENTNRIFKLAEKATPYIYKGLDGENVTESVGSYCPHITRTMSYEMSTLSLLLMGEYPEWGEKISHVSVILSDKDLAICRMLDDQKAERGLTSYSFDDTEKEVKALEALYDSGLMDKKPFTTYKTRFREWCRRFVKLDVMAYYLKSYDSIKGSLHLASMRAFDMDGNQVYGISEKDESCVRIMSKMEKLFLHALIRLPECSDEMSECMEKIERIEWLSYYIASGKSDKLEYLLKCMDAAEDFKNTEE